MMSPVQSGGIIAVWADRWSINLAVSSWPSFQARPLRATA
jgi:hypothetical protein